MPHAKDGGDTAIDAETKSPVVKPRSYLVSGAHDLIKIYQLTFHYAARCIGVSTSWLGD